MANELSRELRLRVMAALVDGNSVRATSRMTGAHQDTISRFGVRLGVGCHFFHNGFARDLTSTLIQVDEQWSFIFKKQSRVTATDPAEYGEAYTYVAHDAPSRFVITWRVGTRDQATTEAFIEDLRSRLLVVPQITSDGYAPYINAISAHFGAGNVHYIQTVKNYSRSGRRDDDYRYEPPRQPFITKRSIFGLPDVEKASTAYTERNNLNSRQFNGRMRRLCLAFSKRLANFEASQALNYVYHNLCRINRTLRVTPAMEAGLTDHVWELGELMDAALAATPSEPLRAKPLRLSEKDRAARELPNGRGFLRVIDGGKAPRKMEQFKLFDD